ncbi:MAG TPA: Zn-dependent hydrolase [Firmicutes bacterium]|nr:Zn-dependent hydrolase [Candidatus Fermentithermobacillaceae bacterium]
MARETGRRQGRDTPPCPNPQAGSDGMRINADRLWRDLTELSHIGRGEKGISRLAFSPADMEGRRWLMGKFEEAGIPARIDGYGNVFGRLEGKRPKEDPRHQGGLILVGSHIDTVPEGGMFDGALGVLAGLECLRTLRESGMDLPCAVEVAAFANEEGARLSPGTFGSRVLLEGVSQSEWSKVYPVLEEAGLDGGGGPGPTLNPETIRAYLELHIEQGGILDRSGEDIGVVEGIVCIQLFHAIFEGEANHAGTTPMDIRKDALQGAAELVLSVPSTVRELGSGRTVGTCGRVEVSPGGRNIIPGRVEVSVEVRDLSEEVAGKVVESLRKKALAIASARGLKVELTPVSVTPGAAMCPEIQDIIEAEARALGLSVRRMPSGAGHDAMTFGRKVPSGMIFVPSRGGISHSPLEWTSKEQCAAGAQVLLRTLVALASRRDSLSLPRLS